MTSQHNIDKQLTYHQIQILRDSKKGVFLMLSTAQHFATNISLSFSSYYSIVIL